jgi:HNH endonuclease/RuvC endonuclease subdomain 3
LGHEPDSTQLLRMRLYTEQGGQCLYTGTSLEPHIDSMLRGEEFVEIDHVWPRSKTFDNSLDNRVLVIAGANRDKGNRIPYEFFNGASGDIRWREFEKRVLSCKGISAEKQRRLLSKSLEDADEFLARNLVDTRYVTRLFATMLREQVEFAGGATAEELESISPEDDGQTRWNRYQRARVRTPQGRLVDFLRGKWGLAHAKDREKSDLHHALDACIIAACTPSLIQQVNQFFAAEEKEPGRHSFKRNSDGTYTHRSTGEVLSRRDAKERGLFLPAPWDGVDKGKFRRDLLERLDKVFVSRRPKRKSAGELHDANPKGIRYLPVPLIHLTEEMLSDLCRREVIGRRFKNVESLRNTLEVNQGDAKKAFANGFELLGKADKPKLVHEIPLPLWSLSSDYLSQREQETASKYADANKQIRDKNKLIREENKKLKKHEKKEILSEIDDHIASKSKTLITTRKTLALTDLSKEKLSEAYLGVTFYNRNKELLEALRARLNEFDDDAKKAFAIPFRPPVGQRGKERPIIRSIRLPEPNSSGVLVNGGIAGLGTSIATEIFWIEEQGYFFRPRYQIDKEATFGLENPPANARHLFTIRIDEPIKVIMKDGSEIPSRLPGYFVVYEGDGRMIIRTHDRPGKGPKKAKKTDDVAGAEQMAESQAQNADDITRHRFSVSGIKKLMKFKVNAIGNYKEIHTHLQHGLA